MVCDNKHGDTSIMQTGCIRLGLAMIRARGAGMEDAQSRGKRMGRPQTAKGYSLGGVLEHCTIFMEGKMNVSELAWVCWLSRPTVDKYLKMVE